MTAKTKRRLVALIFVCGCILLMEALGCSTAALQGDGATRGVMVAASVPTEGELVGKCRRTSQLLLDLRDVLVEDARLERNVRKMTESDIADLETVKMRKQVDDALGRLQAAVLREIERVRRDVARLEEAITSRGH